MTEEEYGAQLDDEMASGGGDSPKTGDWGGTADRLLRLGTGIAKETRGWLDDEKPAARPAARPAAQPNWMKNPAVIGGVILGVVLLVVLILKRK